MVAVTAAAHRLCGGGGALLYREYNNDGRTPGAVGIFLWSRVGLQNGVVQDGGLIPRATGTPGMTVEVPAGVRW